MPVYLATVHSYRSWREDHPKGYVQHAEGLKERNEAIASSRDDVALQLPTRFEQDDQLELHDVANECVQSRHFSLYAIATTPTHVHQLVGFESPSCSCNGSGFCGKACDAYRVVTEYLTEFKRIAGLRLAKRNELPGRKWFSRGWDITPVREPDHFHHLTDVYLPKHEREAGVVRVYRR